MKKTAALFFSLALFLLSAGCRKETAENRPAGTAVGAADAQVPPSQKPAPAEIAEIVDIAERDHLTCAEALQAFYSDAEHVYYYPCIKSEYVLVRYADGTEQTAEDALKEEKISISDLDRFGIQYYAENK